MKAAQLKNLDSLLQRDLSDERIAQDLIPYLQGKFSKVGFFPPVLAVLLPKGFIEGESAKIPDYPKRHDEKQDDKDTSDYEGYWTITRYFSDKAGQQSRLGAISIDPNKTNIIVLDGQHRANAFRYVAGVFDPDEAYQPFYQDAVRSIGYTSDLPVTLIWFESDKIKVRPNDVSRELFVAVNNNAKRVSEARTVLLDDVNVVALGVNTYYRHLASNRGFDTGNQSLLTAAFDLDSGLATSRYPGMALTTPVTLKSAFEYSFFGNPRYDELLERATRHDQQNGDRFKRLFGSLKFVQAGAITRINEGHRDEFRGVFETEYLPTLELLFESSSLTAAHYVACGDIVKWVDNHPEALLKGWWEKAFVGGEGLYSAFQLSKLKKCEQVKKSLGLINDTFYELRRDAGLGKKKATEDLGRLDQCYESFNTIAFQAGFLMMVEFITRKFYKGNWSKARKELRVYLEALTISQWMVFFNEFRAAYIPSVDPASWPRYEKMLIRVFGDFDDAFGDGDTDRYPDYTMVREAVDGFVAESLRSTGAVEKRDVQRVAEKKCAEVAAIVKAFGRKPPSDLESVSIAYGKAKVDEERAERA